MILPLPFSFSKVIIILSCISVSDRIDGSVQERRNSSALAMELHLSCTNPKLFKVIFKHHKDLGQSRMIKGSWIQQISITLMSQEHYGISNYQYLFVQQHVQVHILQTIQEFLMKVLSDEFHVIHLMIRQHFIRYYLRQATKALLEQMLTQVSVLIWHHYATISYIPIV